MRKLWLCLIALIFSVTRVHAAIEISISGVPESVYEDTPVSLSYTLAQGTTANNTVYLRVVFYTEGKTTYFGYTQNQVGRWINSTSDKSQFYTLTVTPEGTASGIITAKLDLENSYFYGPGVYKLKLGRYTSESDSSADWSNELETAVTVRPSPSPSPTRLPTPVTTPEPTPSPTPTPIPSPSLLPKPSPSPSPTPTPDLNSEVGTVAGAATDIDLSGFGTPPLPSGGQTLQGARSEEPILNKTRAKTALIIGLGLIILSLASYFGYRRYLALQNLGKS